MPRVTPDEAKAPRAVAQRDARRRDALDFPRCKAANDNARSRAYNAFPVSLRFISRRFEHRGFRGDKNPLWNVHSSIWSNS
jgi:hypothetical protein